MKKLLFLTVAMILVSALSALADASKLVPPYHWTYHSLKTLSDKELIKEKTTPGKSAYSPDEVVTLIVYAINKIQADPSRMGPDELLSIRQLVNGYKTEIDREGYDSDRMKLDVENYAIIAGLTAMETGGTPSLKPRALSTLAAHSVNEFTFSLYKNLAAAQKRKNIFLSPYSISTALSMTYAGARGLTETEMEKVLSIDPDIHRSMAALMSNINSVPTDTAKVSTANAVWPAKQEKLLAEYVDTVRNYYGASLNPINYNTGVEKARKTINKWVEKQTEGKIKDIIGEGVLRKDTPLVLTNAVYFKSDWLEKFEKHNSLAKPFWVKRDKSVPTIMMNRTGDSIKYAKTGNSEIAELPYKDSRFSMLVILPDKATDIETVEKNVTESLLKEWASKMSPQKVRITIPKFKIEQSFELNKALAEMGMPSAFDSDSADFSGMNGKHNMYIGSVIHKTFVEVGEDGTEAAAATAVIMMKTSFAPGHEDYIEFNADRPFIFLIKDNENNAILFIGRYSHP